MAWDPSKARLLVFGGLGPGRQFMNDTWSFTTDGWTRIETDSAPGARYGSAMVYEAAQDRMVLFGGGGDEGAPDTWIFQDDTWRKLPE